MDSEFYIQLEKELNLEAYLIIRERRKGQPILWEGAIIDRRQVAFFQAGGREESRDLSWRWVGSWVFVLSKIAQQITILYLTHLLSYFTLSLVFSGPSSFCLDSSTLGTRAVLKEDAKPLEISQQFEREKVLKSIHCLLLEAKVCNFSRH